MVGQTTAKPNPRNMHELTSEIKSKWLDAKQKIVDLKKMLTEIERDLAAAEAEERLLDSIIFSMEHMGEPNTKRRTSKRGRKTEDEEEDEEETEEIEEEEEEK
jgi:hypothetical protein